MKNWNYVLWFGVFAILSVILFYSLNPQPPSVGIPSSVDFNDLHLIAYFVFTFVLGVAMRHSTLEKLSKNHYLLPIFVALFIGAAIELGQKYIPGRYLSLGDLGRNLLGSIAAVVVRFILKREKNLNKII